jgi:hypothetical protein
VKKIYFSHLNQTNLALDLEGKARKQLEEKGFGIASEGIGFFLQIQVIQDISRGVIEEQPLLLVSLASQM